MKYCIQEVSLYDTLEETWSNLVIHEDREPRARRNHVSGIIN
jgi:hypothetical protein